MDTVDKLKAMLAQIEHDWPDLGDAPDAVKSDVAALRNGIRAVDCVPSGSVRAARVLLAA